MSRTYLNALNIACIIALICIAAQSWMQVNLGVLGDKGWLLLAARRWLSGQKLYVDIFEVNPPLVVWIDAIPVWISMHFPAVPDYAAFGAVGVMAVSFIVLLCEQIIARHPAFEGDIANQRRFALLLASVFIFLTTPVYFFDREQVMLVFTFPYMLRFMPSLSRVRFPLPMRIIIGALAAMGFCIKPHAVVIFVLLQIVFLVRDRSPFVLKSLENCTIYALGAVYFTVIVIWFRDYFQTILPMALATYSDFGVKGSSHHYFPVMLIAAGIPLVDFQPRHNSPYRRDSYHFMMIPLLYVIYALMNNGWGYSYDPIASTIIIMTGWLLWEYLWLWRDHETRGLKVRQVLSGAKCCAFCLAFDLTFGMVSLAGLFAQVPNFYDGYIWGKSNQTYVDYMEHHHVTSFGLMSGEFTRWPQISRQAHADWVTRFNHLWMVPALAEPGRVAEPKRTQIINFVSKAYAQDIEKNKPQAFIIDTADQFFTYGKRVDLLGLLGQTPEFKKAFTHYRFDTTIDQCKPDTERHFAIKIGCRYDVYLWKDPR